MRNVSSRTFVLFGEKERGSLPPDDEVRSDGANHANDERARRAEESEDAIKLGDQDRECDACEREQGAVENVAQDAGATSCGGRRGRDVRDRRGRHDGGAFGLVRGWRSRVRDAADEVFERLDEGLVRDGVLDERVDLQSHASYESASFSSGSSRHSAAHEYRQAKKSAALTHRHHPNCELVERNRVPRRLCQIPRNLARDAVPEHQVTKSGEEHRHHKGEDVGDVDHRVEGGWLGHVAVKRGDDGVAGELCEPT